MFMFGTRSGFWALESSTTRDQVRSGARAIGVDVTANSSSDPRVPALPAVGRESPRGAAPCVVDGGRVYESETTILQILVFQDLVAISGLPIHANLSL